MYSQEFWAGLASRVWSCGSGSEGGVYRRIGRIGLRATLTFLSLTGGQNRLMYSALRAGMLVRALQKRIKIAKRFSALRAEMPL